MVCRSQGQVAAERTLGLGGQEKEGLLQGTEAGGKAQGHGDQGPAAAAASQQDWGRPAVHLMVVTLKRCRAPLKEGSRGSLQPLCHLRAWSPPSKGDLPGDVTSHEEY